MAHQTEQTKTRKPGPLSPDVKQTRAYCWASGQIGFGERMPKGTLLIAYGPEATLRDIISGEARHAYDNVTLLVPGIPEATDANAGLEALTAFNRRIAARLARAGA